MTIKKFTYTNVVTKGCEGWINLFFDDFCIACVSNIFIADKIKNVIDEKYGESINQDLDIDIESLDRLEGFEHIHIRFQNICLDNGINKLRDLSRYTKKEFLKLKNVGNETLIFAITILDMHQMKFREK